MLITICTPEIVLPACDHGRETVNVIGHLGGDISPVLPYLNATQPGALYAAQANILCFRFEGHPVTLQPNQIAVGGLADGDEAIEVLARLQKMINSTWERRAEIEPSALERKRLNPLAIYKLLPRTNCRGCGLPSCMVFANNLVVGQIELQQCLPLCQEPLHHEEWQQLQVMLDAAP